MQQLHATNHSSEDNNNGGGTTSESVFINSVDPKERVREYNEIVNSKRKEINKRVQEKKKKLELEGTPSPLPAAVAKDLKYG